MKNKPKIGVYYWHNPTRLGNLELVNSLRRDFGITLISNEDVPCLQMYADDILLIDFTNPKVALKKIKSYKDRKGLDGSITLSEGAVALEADVAEELSLRGNSPEKARVARNKYQMRKLFKSLGIPQPKFFKAESLEEAIDIAEGEFRGRSFFLKPPCIGGSAYCSRIKSIKELKEKWRPFFEGSRRMSTKVPLFNELFGNEGEGYFLLLEELLGGTQFAYDDVLGPEFPIFEMSVEGLIEGDNTFVYSMTDKLLPCDNEYGEEHMWRMHSRIPPKLKEILAKRVSRINRALEATKGCSHTEFRIEETDKANSDIYFGAKYYRARVIETALRIGGAFMQPAILKATGFNSIRVMAYQSCGLEQEERVLYRTPMIMANLWSKRNGKLIRIEGLDKILSLGQSLMDFHLYDPIGGMVTIPPEASRGIADAVVVGSSVDLLEHKGWEISSGNNSLYKETEELYLEVIKAFKPIVQ